jgi:hypothetical protein
MTEERYGAITNGLLLMSAGTALALHSAGRLDVWALMPWWPVLLLLPAGQALLVRQGCLGGWPGAALWVGAAIVALLHTHRYVAFRLSVLVPAALVVVGVVIIWQGLAPQSREPHKGGRG